MRRTRLLEPLDPVVRAHAHPPPPLLQDEVRFDVRLMQRVPYEGVSRMQTSLRRRHRDRVVRRFVLAS